MLIRGATGDQIEQALSDTNAQHGSDIRFAGSGRWGNTGYGLRGSGTTYRCTLRCNPGVFSRRRPYVRCKHNYHRSYGLTSCPTDNGCRPTRMASVCWHGHRAFMRALFALAPDARITTGIITYKGSEDFERTHDDTGYRNIGSAMSPVAWREACDCIDMEQHDHRVTRFYAELDASPRYQEQIAAYMERPTVSEDAELGWHTFDVRREFYGDDEAYGAANAAMANALRVGEQIARERREARKAVAS